MMCRIGFSDDVKWTPWGWAIKKYLKADFYHTYFYVPELDEVWESTTKGVKCSKREPWLKTHKVVSEFELYLTHGRGNQLLEFAHSREGTPYGYLQYLAILFKLGIDNNLKRTICSEFISRGFQKELGLTDDNTLDNITPKDVYDILKRQYPTHEI